MSAASTSRTHVFSSISALLCAAALAGCSGSGAETTGSPPIKENSTTEVPTFHKHVEPILQRSCMGCHSAGNIAPFSLTSYEDAKTVAGAIVEKTQARVMPPFSVRNTDECTTRLGWKDDIQLSDKDLSTLSAWNDAGAPEGDVKDAPPAFVPESPDLPGKTLEIQPKTSYVTSGDKDEFRCFVIDPALTEDQYMNGLQLVPGNKKVVHHALVFIDPERKIEALAGPDGSFPCGAGDLPMGPGAQPGQMIDAWAPGADPLDFSADVGYLIPKGSLVWMQIHYHPAGTTADPDSTHIQLRLAKEKPKYGFLYSLIGNFDTAVNPFGFGLLPDPEDTNGVEFLIPANSKHHTETVQFTIPTPDSPIAPYFPFPAGMRIYGEFLHMHYLGFDQKVTLTRKGAPEGQAAEECLAHAPQWDFSWQRSYAYDAPIDALPAIEPGDVLKIRCTYNNSTENPYVARALRESHMSSTVDVRYGEGNTLDEMCLSGLSLVYPMP